MATRLMLVLVNTIRWLKIMLTAIQNVYLGAVLMSIGLFWTFCVVCFCCYPKDFDDPRMRFSSENCIPICETVQFINGELNLDCRLRRSVTKIWHLKKHQQRYRAKLFDKVYWLDSRYIPRVKNKVSVIWFYTLYV